MPSTATSIKGNYENKVRRGSPIEKIFDVFATGKNKDGLYMSFFDLLRAVCPFNYSTKDIEDMRAYLKENPPKALIELIDLDGSGDVSVVEYYIFWVLHESRKMDFLSLVNIPDLRKQFKTDDPKNKNIPKSEFLKFLKNRGDKVKINLTETILPVNYFFYQIGR